MIQTARATHRALALIGGIATATMALQGTGLATPPETFTANWTAQPTCYNRTATATVNPASVGENIQFTLFVTVNGHTYSGPTIDSGTVGAAGPVSASPSVTAPCPTASGRDTAVYDLYIQGYRKAPALPDYLIDQAHAYSVCYVPDPTAPASTDPPAPSCQDADTVGLPLDLNVPPAPYVGHLP